MDINKAFKKSLNDGNYNFTISGTPAAAKIYHLPEEELLELFTNGYKQSRIDTLEEIQKEQAATLIMEGYNDFLNNWTAIEIYIDNELEELKE